jgi:hypothetical protein
MHVLSGHLQWRRVHRLQAVGKLNGAKPNERVVKCSWVKFKWEEVKCRQAQ